jgi:hypothetical protein
MDDRSYRHAIQRESGHVRSISCTGTDTQHILTFVYLERRYLDPSNPHRGALLGYLPFSYVNQCYRLGHVHQVRYPAHEIPRTERRKDHQQRQVSQGGLRRGLLNETLIVTFPLPTVSLHTPRDPVSQ